MARLEFEVRKREGSRGVFFMGSLKFPAEVNVSDMIGFFFPDDRNPDKGRIVLEPRRDPCQEVSQAKPQKEESDDVGYGVDSAIPRT